MFPVAADRPGGSNCSGAEEQAAHGCQSPRCSAPRAAIVSLAAARRPRSSSARVGVVELEPIAVGAFEVVADDLVLLDERCVLVEPVGERLVELGPGPLGERVVGGVADQEVAEAERLLVGVGRLVGPDHLLAHEREEVSGHVVPLGGGRELLHGAAVEDLALDGAAADHVPLAGAEPVEPGLEERLNRRRDDDLSLAAVLAHGGEHLLDEQRISVRGLQDPRSYVVRELCSAREPGDQSLAVLARERLEQDRGRVELAAAPVGPQLEQFRAGDAEEEDRCVARPVRHVLDQVEEDGFGPLDVVEYEDLGPLDAATPRSACGT